MQTPYYKVNESTCNKKALVCVLKALKLLVSLELTPSNPWLKKVTYLSHSSHVRHQGFWVNNEQTRTITPYLTFTITVPHRQKFSYTWP